MLVIIFGVTYILSSANAFRLDQSKILSFGRANCGPNNGIGIDKVENVVLKEENADISTFSSFPIMFTIPFFRVTQLKSVWWWINGSIEIIILNVFQFTLCLISPGFYVSTLLVFWKHCGKWRNCSLSHSVLYRFWQLSVIFIKFEIVVCKFFQFQRV